MHSLEILHDTPGRLRLAVPAVLGSPARAAVCAEAVRSLPAVHHAHANPLTGSLLVLYTPSSRARESILELWPAECDGSRAPMGTAHGRSRRSRRRHRGTVAIPAELVRHLLPLLLGACPICRGR